MQKKDMNRMTKQINKAFQTVIYNMITNHSAAKMLSLDNEVIGNKSLEWME